MNRLGITSKLSLVFVLFAGLVLAGLSIPTYNNGRAALEAATVSELLTTALEKQAALNAWVADRQHGIGDIVNQTHLRETASALMSAAPGSLDANLAHAGLVKDLGNWAGEGHRFLSMEVIDAATGRVIAATDASEEGKFREEQPYFLNGLQAPYVQNPYFDLSRGRPSMTAAAPVLSPEGKVIAVLAGPLNMDEMNAIVQRRSGLRQTDDAFLVNTSNLFVTQPRLVIDPAVLQRGVHSEAVNRCLEHNSGVIDDAPDYRNVPAITVYRWLPERQLCLEVKIDQAEAFAAERSLGGTLLITGAVVLLLASALAFALACTITRPVRELTTGAAEIGKGNLDYRIQSRATDEIGQLASAFNAMAANLRGSLGETARGHRMLFALSQAAQAVQRARTPDEVYRAVGQAITGLGYQAIVLTLSKDHTRLTLTHHTVESSVVRAGEKLVGLSAQGFHFDIKPGSIHYQVVTTGQPRFFEHAEEALADSLPNLARPLIGYLAALLGIEQIIYAPLTSEGTTIGLLEVVGKGLAEADVPAIATFANQTAIALENMRLYQEAQQRAEMLRQSEEKYRNLTEGLNEVVYRADPQTFAAKYVNQAIESMYGYTVEEWLADPSLWENAIHPDDKERAFAEFTQAQAQLASAVIAYRIIRKDKTVRWVEDHVTWEKDRQGQAISMNGLMYDFTERRQAEETLERRLTELNALNTIATIVTESSDVNTIINRAMDEALRLVGVKAAATLLLDKAAGELVMTAHRGVGDEFVHAFSRLKLGDGLSGQVAQTGKATIMKNLDEYPAARKVFVEKERIQSAAVVPLIGSSGVIGVMNLAATSPQYFDAAGIDLLMALGRQIAIGVEKARLYQETRAWAAELEQRVKERAEALRVSEEQYRRIVETAQEGIWTIDAANNTSLVNAKMAEMLGYTPDEMMGAPLFAFMDEEGQAIAAANVERRRQGIAEQHDFKFKRKDGADLWALLSTNPIFDKAGQYAGALAMVVDITERRRTEKALQASEEKHRLLVNNIDELVYVVDVREDPLAGKLEFVSAQSENILGYTPAEFLNDPSIWFQCLHPDDVASVVALTHQLTESKDRVTRVYRMRHKLTGECRWLEDRVTAQLDEHGHLAKYFGVARDVTERKQMDEALRRSEEQYRLLAENATDVIWTVDMAMQATYFSPSVARLLGFSVQEAMSRTMPEAYAPASLHKAVQATQEELALEQSGAGAPNRARLLELELNRKDGSTVPVEANFSFLRDAAGRPVGVLSIARDITERKRAEEALAVQAAQLAAANAELSQYAYVVSHDVRAPLRAIRNYADFLREDLAETLAPAQQTYLDGLNRAVHEAEELVEDILELARIGRQSLPVETLNVGAFLRELAARMALPPEVDVVMAADWPTLKVEPLLFRQIFQNLIENAVKFNSAPRKRVELGWRAAGGASVEFWVRDNGIGIDPRYHEQIFRVFERLHTRQEYDGTGIGLAIVKKAVGELGGSIRLESQPGEGSTFFVTFPEAKV